MDETGRAILAKCLSIKICLKKKESIYREEHNCSMQIEASLKGFKKILTDLGSPPIQILIDNNLLFLFRNILTIIYDIIITKKIACKRIKCFCPYFGSLIFNNHFHPTPRLSLILSPQHD
jgi:hypothetical protein